METTENVRDFDILAMCKCGNLARLCRYVLECTESGEPIARNPLSVFVQETRRSEEFLDAYGAKHNTYWGPFRAIIAAGKFASDVLYKALHLKYAAPFYHLYPVEGDFIGATDEAVRALTAVLADVSREFLSVAAEMELDLPSGIYNDYCPENELPRFFLPWDTGTRRNPEAGRTVVNIATAFLNQLESSDIIGTYRVARERPLRDCVPDLFCERQLRRYENEFHNLQAMYDTALTGTDTESADRDLPFLRGHITVVFHLLEIATAVGHYQERHVRSCQEEKGLPLRFLSEERARTLLLDYSMAYVVRYLEKARDLCRSLLQKYAENAEISVPAPVYRGFHVRPSSLVAKIVRHYGTTVTMSLDDDTCDASSAMDIIRFNEKIYAIKRRRIAQEVARTTDRIGGEELMPVFLSLLEERKIVLYSGGLQLEDFPRVPGETLAEYANRGLARLLATGAIDIRSDIEIRLHGDIRVLEDIRILAMHGYGEDSMGNNVTLPVELSYLRR
ncbi:MAG: hypothetical protein EA427_09275 [Spirochaetaceae bacterium]|nr:MAG: hypothetical protein EA427_09275 [Spirochaetaceae bacterium]